MEAENKKYLIYGGVAFLVGSLGYFIYSTLKNKKPSVAENETVKFSEKETTSDTNPFTDMLNNPAIPTGIKWEWKDELFSKPLTSKSILL
jgi:hypothetical protein